MENQTTNPPVIKNINGDDQKKLWSLGNFLIFIFLAIVLGSLVGFTASKLSLGKKESTSSKTANTAGTKVGITDKKTFKDSAEGVLKEGGIDGEGNFHLVRPGGESQNVYLTSSTVDLSPFVGKKVRVWGQTFTGQKAGWLMDVGLVEVL
jgi:hypothetical protein